MDLSRNLDENLEIFRNELAIDTNYDVILRRLTIGGKRAALIYIDGLLNDQVMSIVMRNLMSAQREQVLPSILESILSRHLPYTEVSTVSTVLESIEQVLSGPALLLVDGIREGIIIDAREYPVRAVGETDLERVTRGAKDGFVETIVFNTALIRRRVRDAGLRFESVNAGNRSRTDIVIGYIEDLAPKKIIEQVKQRIKQVDTDGLPMGSKSLEEYLVGVSLNPLPKVRFSERPDVVAAHLYEGHVIVLVDTTPAAMILPAAAWQFTQHAEEYFQHPVVGSWLRWVRFAGILIALLLTPLWLALVKDISLFPAGWSVIGPKEPSTVPIFVQFILLELGFDLIRMAFIHTPNALASSLGIVGAVLLGQLAVTVGLFVPETILYTAVVAIGSFAIPSLEFSLAIRMFRLLLLILAGFFGLGGLGVGVLFVFLVFLFTKSFGTPYLWPLIPFNGSAFVRLLFRTPVPEARERPMAQKDGTDKFSGDE
ncbi:MAG: spore germination protein [Limnochordia bacterium]|jgi:stage V sporulation protein AF|nr:spore germination protein [Limnochordia bacterium]MDD2628697.1 spore germination protein [Limnochordia bacterium]MDD4517553.1 spore germination protein [Limnochordia bacterium]